MPLIWASEFISIKNTKRALQEHYENKYPPSCGLILSDVFVLIFMR